MATKPATKIAAKTAKPAAKAVAAAPEAAKQKTILINETLKAFFGEDTVKVNLTVTDELIEFSSDDISGSFKNAEMEIQVASVLVTLKKGKFVATIVNGEITKLTAMRTSLVAAAKTAVKTAARGSGSSVHKNAKGLMG